MADGATEKTGYRFGTFKGVFMPSLLTILGVIMYLLGDLNAIAPILSMFFLTSYAVLNLSAGLEAASGGPAWRPSLRVP
jgi:hypothetical protein